MRFVVVEDDAIMRDALTFGLQLHWPGAEIREAPDGVAGLTTILESDADLVLLDITLPKLSGFDVLQRARQYSAVPIIMMTARDEVSDHDRARALGADGFVTKPFRRTALFDCLDQVLCQRVPV